MKIVIILLIFTLCITNSFAQVAIIANKSVPEELLNSSKILDFYSKDVRTWSNGDPVTVFDLKPKNEVKKTFYEFLGISISRIKSIWLKNMLSGEGDPPKALESEEEMIQKIVETKGSIGYISAEKVNDQIRTLLVIESKEN
jgi:ABC-type phosphate transport system substrate-binding protein